MKRISSKILFLLPLWFLLLGSSCRDDMNYYPADGPVEGEPATVSFKVRAGNIVNGTRYSGYQPDDPDVSQVNHLWVGIYNAGTGIRIAQTILGGSNVTIPHNKYGEIVFKDIPSMSGKCYIVAVANSDTNDAISASRDGGTLTKETLLSLLENADTWEKYCNIANVLSNPESVSRVSADFPMSGVYGETGDETDPSKWNPSTVNIYPGMNELAGSIHLRRLDSYVKFIIRPGANITVIPVSWQVKNLPGISFVQERAGSCTADGEALINAADAQKNGNLWTSEGTHPSFYANSQVFLANTFIKERDESGLTGAISFDFYQMENKHTGIINTEEPPVNAYAEREREFKNPSPTVNDEGKEVHDPREQNSGWYKSLVRERGTVPAAPTSAILYRNNNATFVELHLQVEYYYKKGDRKFTPVPNTGETDLIQRVADAVYTIHLGYCDYGSGADVNDFNCYRNTSCTYTVTVNGADNIRVEAVRDGEPESGAEGTVTDLEEEYINMDCHYGVFNIQLSDTDRENLTWRIRTPFGDDYIDMVSGPGLESFTSNSIINLNTDSNQGIKDALPQNQFYNWVQIVPTTDRGVIAHYPGDPRIKNRTDLNGYPHGNIPDAGSNNGVWYLEDLKDIVNHKHPQRNEEGKDASTKLWYTVFIDEYVYEHAYLPGNSSMTGNGILSLVEWRNFVNRDTRKLWIRLGDPKVSYDGESIYSESLYLLSQESIQTYYNNNASTAIGLEHINETYEHGKELDWKSYNENKYDENDGLLNLYKFVNGKKATSEEKYTEDDLKNYQWTWEDRVYHWADVFISNNMGNSYSNHLYSFKNGHTHSGGSPQSATFYIPNHPHNAMMGCLARNRDLNNNGEIEPNEMRWYLPTAATYTRMVLGTISLKTPLLNLLDYGKGEMTAGTGKQYSHYAASDRRMLWAEELAATGSLNAYDAHAGTIRCIRNLGQDMNITPGTTGNADLTVDKAYELDDQNHIIRMTYYRSAALRPETRGHIQSHYIGDIMSYPARSFRYAKEDCKPLGTENGNTQRIFENQYLFIKEDGTVNEFKAEKDRGENWDLTTMYTLDGWMKSVDANAICGGYAEEPNRSDQGTWRVPNISELAILFFLKAINTNGGHHYRSCSREYFEGATYTDWTGAPESRFMGINMNAHDVTAGMGENFYVRCVKDVME